MVGVEPVFGFCGFGLALRGDSEAFGYAGIQRDTQKVTRAMQRPCDRVGTPRNKKALQMQSFFDA